MDEQNRSLVGMLIALVYSFTNISGIKPSMNIGFVPFGSDSKLSWIKIKKMTASELLALAPGDLCVVWSH